MFPFRRFNTIRTKMAVVFTMLIAIIALFIYLYFPAKLENQAMGEMAEKARVIGLLSTYSLAPSLYFEDYTSGSDVLKGIMLNKVIIYGVIEDLDKNIFVASNTRKAKQINYKDLQNKISQDRSIYKYSEPIYHNGKKIGDLYLGISLNRINDAIKSSKLSIAITSIIIFILGMFSVFIISSIITERLKNMVKTVKEIAKGNLSRRTEVFSEDEVGQLGSAFNVMVENLEEVYNELENVNRELENRVEERTVLLQQEMQEHTNTVEKLYKSETRSRAIINTLPDQMYMFNKDGCCLEFKSDMKPNPYLKLKDLEGKHVREIYPSDVAEQYLEKMSSTISTGEPQELEYHLRQNETLRHFESRFVNSWDDEILVITREITDRKEAEKAILESESKFRALAETLPTAIFIIHGTQCIYINPYAKMYSGYSEEELFSMNFWDIVHPDYQSYVKLRGLERQQGKEVPERYEFKITTKTGEEKWVDFSARLIEFQGNSVILGSATDITEQKAVEEQLRKLSRAVEQSTISVLITDYEGIIEYVNPRFSKVTGYLIEEVVGKKPSILKSGITSFEEYQFLWNTIKQGKEWKGEFLNKKKNGDLYWELTSISGIRNSDNKITHFLSIKEDITEKKLVEEKVIQSERDYRGLFENALDGMLIFDPNTAQILDANPHSSLIFGFERSDLIGKKLHDLSLEIPGKRIFDDLLITTNLKNYEVVHHRSNGSNVYLDVNTTFTSYQGERAILGIFRDISERKDFENALMKAKEEAEKSDRLKSEFLAQMSHEIRTPINAILSFNSLLKDELSEKVSDDLRQSFRIIDNGGRRLIRTIDLILNMSQIQSGSYEIYPAEFDLVTELIEHTVVEFDNIARVKSLTLCLTNNAKHSRIQADHYTVTQIFTNLLDNAIKFTHTGSVEISIFNPKPESISVKISDTGIGISPEYLPKLFTPFSQEEMGYTRSFEGNGLGLALVKKYADLNGAEIRVSSRKGEGTTFSVSFNCTGV